jgi:hypothetical protein
VLRQAIFNKTVMAVPCKGGHIRSSKYEGLFVAVDPFGIAPRVIQGSRFERSLTPPRSHRHGKSKHLVGSAILVCPANKDLGPDPRVRVPDPKARIPDPRSQDPGLKPLNPDLASSVAPRLGPGSKTVLKSYLNLQHNVLPCGQSHINEYPVGKDVTSLESEHAVPLVPVSTTGSLMVSQQQYFLGSEFGDTVKLGGVPWSQTKCSLSDLKLAVYLSFRRSEAVISLKRKRVSKSKSAKRQRTQVSASIEADTCLQSL